jgi:hypothetical protein
VPARAVDLVVEVTVLRRLVALVFLAGAAQAAPRWRALPLEPVGVDWRPYNGLPYYLQSKPPPHVDLDREPAMGIDERQPVVGHRDLPTGERRARLHALLAAVDAHAYTVGDRPSIATVRALELTLAEIGELLAPYPDIEYEVVELRRLTDDIPTTPAARLPRLRARMTELTDLIRVQLVAGT